MKHIFLNLKRFDIPKEYGGVNAIAAMKDWGSYIVEQTQKGLMERGCGICHVFPRSPHTHSGRDSLRRQSGKGRLPGSIPPGYGSGGELRSLYYQPHS